MLFKPSDFQRLLDSAVQSLEPIKDKFDAIVVTGNSGAIFGGALSLTLDKPLILVRKPEIDCHTSWLVEGENRSKTYIFVDDLVSSGNTEARVHRTIAESSDFRHMNCVGKYLYSYGQFYPTEMMFPYS